ncbi:MAG: sulfurtransferase TusA family protein [Actinomycetota bacterium]
MEGIPVGDVLETVARDPSARDDLPALARMLGHEVLSSEWGEDASVIVSVKRMK